MHPQRVNIPLQGLDRRVMTVGVIPLPNRSPPLVPFHQLWTYMVRKMYSGEADQLTLGSLGIEHASLFSVAISWGNKMNFSLYANMSFFAQMVT